MGTMRQMKYRMGELLGGAFWCGEGNTVGEAYVIFNKSCCWLFAASSRATQQNGFCAPANIDKVKLNSCMYPALLCRAACYIPRYPTNTHRRVPQLQHKMPHHYTQQPKHQNPMPHVLFTFAVQHVLVMTAVQHNQ